MRAIKAWWLKRRLKSAYLQYLRAMDRVSCGHSMAMTLQSVLTPASRFDRLADQLAAMGEAVPKTRLMNE